MKVRSWAIFAALALALVVAPGCGDSSPPADADTGPTEGGGPDGDTGPTEGGGPCTLSVTTINGRAVDQVTEITAADDQDATKPGIQIDVAVSGVNLADGQDVELSVSGLLPNPSDKASGGKAEFKGVTVATNLTNVLITASTPSGECSQDSKTFSVTPGPECFFADPTDGAALNQADDSSSNVGFQYTVVVRTLRAEGGTVTLERNPGGAAGQQSVAANGDATFTDADLQPGSVTLTATVKVGNVEAKCSGTVTISTTVPNCVINFTTAAPITIGGKNGLGSKHDVAPATAGLQTDIEITTGGLVTTVELYLDGQKVDSKAPTAGKATFAAFDFGSPNPAKLTRQLQAVCIESGSGNTGQSTLDFEVDIDAPGTIQAPTCTVTDRRAGDVECCWTTIADEPAAPNGVGPKEYEIRSSTSGPITAANWATSTVSATVSAKPAGQQQCATIAGLGLASSYYFGLRLGDWVENLSAVATPATDPTPVDVALKLRANAASVATGDFNCDGHTDVAIGRPGVNSNVGEVRIYLGNPNGILASPEKRIAGTIAGGRFGAKLAALKNFDGDSGTPVCNDLAVLADYNGSSSARVYVYFGRTGFFDRTDVLAGNGAEVYFALASGAGAGERIANIANGGDFDNDGRTDLVVTWHDTGSADAAEVWVVYGDQSIPQMVAFSSQTPVARAMPTDVGLRVPGGKASEQFGMALCGAGSLDTGAFSDIVVGAGGFQDSGTTRGRVWVVRGATRAGTLPETLALTDARVNTIAAGTSNGGFGAAVGVVGDMNGDGNPEFVAGDTTTATDTGTVYIFNYASGTTAPTNVAGAAATVANDVTGAAGDKLGAALACPIDLTSSNVDGDSTGYQDLVVAALDQGTAGVGVVYQLNGATGALANFMTSAAPYKFLPRTTPVTAFGTALHVAKDVDKDGYADVVVLDPTHSTTGQFFLFH